MKDLNLTYLDWAKIPLLVIKVIGCFCPLEANWNGIIKKSGKRSCYMNIVGNIFTHSFCLAIASKILVNTTFVSVFGRLLVLYIVNFFFLGAFFFQHLHSLNSLCYWTHGTSTTSNTTKKSKTAEHKVPLTKQLVNISSLSEWRYI